PKTEQTDHQDRVTRRVMPVMNRGDASLCSQPDEKESANQVAKECEEGAGNNQGNTTQERKFVKFSQEKGDHEGGLQRSDAGAGFVDADKPGADFDDVAQLDGGNSDRV